MLIIPNLDSYMKQINDPIQLLIVMKQICKFSPLKRKISRPSNVIDFKLLNRLQKFPRIILGIYCLTWQSLLCVFMWPYDYHPLQQIEVSTIACVSGLQNWE